MRKSTAFIAGLLLAAPCVADTVEFASLTEECEESLALSALPLELRDRASVWVWRNGDFVRSRASDGGFDCIVQRNHPDSIIPECITSTGRDSILEGIKLRTRLVARFCCCGLMYGLV